MRIPRYWKRVEGPLTVDGETIRSTVHGDSNISLEDAHAVGLQYLARIQARIDGRPWPEEDYAVSIREEIVEELHPDAVVTRNRYGAEVLNCARLLMIDVDGPPPPQGLWQWLFRRDRRPAKERLLEHLRTVARQQPPRLQFRLYATHSGFRVIVTGQEFAPSDPEVDHLFQAMRADPLYALLCRKQDCFRARLTPKPSRIRQKAIRLRYPYDDKLQARLDTWSVSYAERGQRYAVCKLMEVIGRDDPDRVVRYHDERTGAYSDRPLA